MKRHYDPPYYHNTNREVPPELDKSAHKAYVQEALVHSWFWKHRGQAYSPCDVWEIVFAKKVPLTSVRRAITNLTSRDVLEKTGRMKIGHFGKQVHLWRAFTGTLRYKQSNLF